MSSSKHVSRMHGLDTLRAFAVLVVVLFHLTVFGELPSKLLSVTYYGWMGVDLFFVLSGFLIGQQLFKSYLQGQPFSIRDFYLRRAYRILPTYWTVLALYLLVPAWREYPHLPPVWKLLTFTMNLGFSFSQRGFSHAWSLCVEEHFYLVLPLLVMVCMRKPSANRAIALAASVVLLGLALRYLLVVHYPDQIWVRIYYPSYTRLDGLVAGVMLAALRSFRPSLWHRIAGHGHLLLGFGALCVGSVGWMFRHQDLGNDEGPAKWGVIFGFPLLAFGLALMTASSVSRNGWLARIRMPGAYSLATLAFSLYLTHKPVAHFVMLHGASITQTQGPASWLLYATSCLGIAWLLHLAIERPVLRLRDRALRTMPQKQLEDAMKADPAL